jgi:hypothetical protein
MEKEFFCGHEMFVTQLSVNAESHAGYNKLLFHGRYVTNTGTCFCARLFLAFEGTVTNVYAILLTIKELCILLIVCFNDLLSY